MLLNRTKDSLKVGDKTYAAPSRWKPSRAIEVTLTDQIKRLAEPLLRSLGLELFDLCFSGSQRGGHLQVFIDKQEGVSLGDCERFSRLLGPALDVDDLIPNNYTLEVSSPGLDRPLREKADYHRFIGKRVRIKTVLKIENQKVFVGKLVDFSDETVILLVDEGDRRKIPFAQIVHARLETEQVAGSNGGGLKK